MATRARVRGRSRADQFQKEASSPGLAPEDNLMIVERCDGRRNCPLGNGSTVAPYVSTHYRQPRPPIPPTAKTTARKRKKHQRPAIDNYSSTEVLTAPLTDRLQTKTAAIGRGFYLRLFSRDQESRSSPLSPVASSAFWKSMPSAELSPVSFISCGCGSPRSSSPSSSSFGMEEMP